MRCRRVQPHLLDFSTGRLEAGTTRRVAAHLESCSDCRRLLKREQRTAALLGAIAGVESRADVWPAIETALRSAAPTNRRLSLWQPLVWAGGLAATAILTVSLVVPGFRGPSTPAEPDPLSAFAPRAAAGLVPDRARDPLMSLERKLDRTLDRLADEGS